MSHLQVFHFINVSPITSFNAVIDLGCRGLFALYLHRKTRLVNAVPRTNFLQDCLQKELIPRFLNFERLISQLAEKIENLLRARIEASIEPNPDQMGMLTLDEYEELNSLDVKSLYTNVPVDEATSLTAKTFYFTTSPDL